MKFIILTVEGGKTIPHEEVREKLLAAKEKILATGMQYIQREVLFGSYDALGQRVETRAYEVEGVANGSYV